MKTSISYSTKVQPVLPLQICQSTYSSSAPFPASIFSHIGPLNQHLNMLSIFPNPPSTQILFHFPKYKISKSPSQVII